jgi:hypothetical protein
MVGWIPAGQSRTRILYRPARVLAPHVRQGMTVLERALERTITLFLASPPLAAWLSRPISKNDSKAAMIGIGHAQVDSERLVGHSSINRLGQSGA